ncbi:MAG: Ig-like domain-containing protein, partial [Betaproteobacteria bacterium]|nr:Ig-like domain-containing protein [Betaproteobacteria bacterium]
MLSAATAITGAVKFTLIDAYHATTNPTGLALNSTVASVGTVQAGATVNIPYTGATTGANRFISAVITNNTGVILFYGKLAAANSANGTASFTVPPAAALPNGNYTIRLFVEEANGDNATDFASTLIDIAMTVANGAGTVPVTGITVTGAGNATTITTNGGTLQMAAAVTPGNASNQTVTWSVTPAGRATINASGLLTATGNGTVTVTATATDGSGISGSTTITISGQSGTGTVPVTGITVTGAGNATTITTNGGTLQMAAAVTPGNASNQTVTWSVT